MESGKGIKKIKRPAVARRSKGTARVKACEGMREDEKMEKWKKGIFEMKKI